MSTAIEWTHRAGTKGETWNPVAGCTIDTPGCTNCYAMKMAARIEAIDAAAGRTSHYAGTTKKVKGKAVWTCRIGVAPDHIMTAPLRWRSPRTVFVNSMSDLFHPSVPDAVIDRVFAVMALCPQHIFQVLTKRAKRMREYVRNLPNRDDLVGATAVMLADWTGPAGARERVMRAVRMPLPNVWLGVSAEDQTRADERVPHLLATPAAIRFVSAEPLLGPIDFSRWMLPTWARDCLAPMSPDTAGVIAQMASRPVEIVEMTDLDWVIVGGESGPGARPMHPDWARSIRDQCAAAGVPFFFKQWGEWLPWEPEHGPCWVSQNRRSEDHHALFPVDFDNAPEWDDGLWAVDEGHAAFQRVGKKAAGRLLDGVEHNGFPEICEVPLS